MKVTHGVKHLSRRLSVSYPHLKKYMKLYTNEEGVTLMEVHKNKSMKGIPNYANRKSKEIPLDKIIDGTVPAENYEPNQLKDLMIHNGHVMEKCNSCGYKERRIQDYKMPLLLNFKDGNKKNYSLGNVNLLCYNCYFLQVGEIFTSNDLDHLEGHIEQNQTTDSVNFEVDDYMLRRFKELGLSDEADDDPDGLNELISRK